MVRSEALLVRNLTARAALEYMLGLLHGPSAIYFAKGFDGKTVGCLCLPAEGSVVNAPSLGAVESRVLTLF